MSEFKREERFIVIKRKHLSAESRTHDSLEQELRVWLDRRLVPTSECVVVESDWPEYETVWSMIAARVEGRSTPYQVLEQQVAALRQHKNDYMEAAEGTRRALNSELEKKGLLLSEMHEALSVADDRLEAAKAEAQALREEVAALRRFAGEIYQVLGALDAPENVLDNASDAANGDKLRHKTLLPFAALRARVVVPDGYALVPVVATDDMVEHVMATGLYHDKNASAVLRDEYRHMVEAAPRINGKAVSEGLLRRIAEYGDDFWFALDELKALLGEGKEVGDVLVRE